MSEQTNSESFQEREKKNLRNAVAQIIHIPKLQIWESRKPPNEATNEAEKNQDLQ